MPSNKKNRLAHFVCTVHLWRVAKKRINLSIDPKLHDWAQTQAEKLGTTFSAYVSDLLRRERDGVATDFRLTDAQRSEMLSKMRAEVSEDLLLKLMQQRRAKR